MPQQAHLDVRVPDVDAAERAVLALGAVRVGQPDDARGFRVFRDPAGHPFCLVFGGTPVTERAQFASTPTDADPPPPAHARRMGGASRAAGPRR